MQTTVSRVKDRPAGMLRLFYKVPPLMYRLGLGRIVGKSFLVLTTTGRKSGTPRSCGLNYVRDGDTVYVFSGYGKRTDWYRNLEADPRVYVRLGSDSWAATAAPVEDAAERRRLVHQLSDTAAEQAPPRSFRPWLKRLIGFDYDAEVRASLENWEAIPVVALRPVEEGARVGA